MNCLHFILHNNNTISTSLNSHKYWSFFFCWNFLHAFVSIIISLPLNICLYCVYVCFYAFIWSTSTHQLEFFTLLHSQMHCNSSNDIRILIPNAKYVFYDFRYFFFFIFTFSHSILTHWFSLIAIVVLPNIHISVVRFNKMYFKVDVPIFRVNFWCT